MLGLLIYTILAEFRSVALANQSAKETGNVATLVKKSRNIESHGSLPQATPVLNFSWHETNITFTQSSQIVERWEQDELQNGSISTNELYQIESILTAPVICPTQH